jgi:circadian clock protein KaiB
VSASPRRVLGRPAAGGGETYRLRLYVSGMTPRSAQAIASIKRICDARLAGRYELDVIDLYRQPERARLDQIIAVPTLIKSRPLPVRRLIGDLSDERRVLIGLSLWPWAAHPEGS